MNQAPSVDLEHMDLPSELKTKVSALSDDECRRQLWLIADGLARGEGYELGTGLQRRAGEILGVQEAQASRANKRKDRQQELAHLHPIIADMM